MSLILMNSVNDDKTQDEMTTSGCRCVPVIVLMIIIESTFSLLSLGGYDAASGHTEHILPRGSNFHNFIRERI